MRKWILRLLGADHLELANLLMSGDSTLVKDILRRCWSPDVDDRIIFSRVYAEAEAKGVEARGWKLRFLMYYWAGVFDGEWD